MSFYLVFKILDTIMRCKIFLQDALLPTCRAVKLDSRALVIEMIFPVSSFEPRLAELTAALNLNDATLPCHMYYKLLITDVGCHELAATCWAPSKNCLVEEFAQDPV